MDRTEITSKAQKLKTVKGLHNLINALVLDELASHGAGDKFRPIKIQVLKDLKQYKVIYYFLTSGNYSKILFYVNKEMSLTQAFPSSDLGEGDELMKKLIERLQNER